MATNTKGKDGSIQHKNSRYVQGGTTDVLKKRLGWWERKVYPRFFSDIQFQITQAFHLRPDLVAKKFYGSTALTWLVLQYNNIVDINTEFVAGEILTLPTPERALSSLLASQSQRRN